MSHQGHQYWNEYFEDSDPKFENLDQGDLGSSMGSFHFTTSAEYNAPGFYETATPTTNAAFSFNTQNAHATGSFGNQGFLDRSQSSYHAWYPQGAESVSQPQQQYTQGQPQQQIGTRSTQIQPQQQSTNYKSQIEWHKAACKALLAVRRDKFEAGFGKQLDQWDEASSRYVEGTPAYNQMAAGYLDWYIGTYKRMSEELGVSQHIYPNDADSDSDEDDDEGYPPAAAEGSKAASTNKDKSKSFPCPYPNCQAAPARKADLDRHLNAVHHKDPGSLLYCNDPICPRSEKPGGKGFSRKDHLIEHYRSVHGRHEEYPKKQTTRKSESSKKKKRSG